MNDSPFPVIFALDALTGALFLLVGLGVLPHRRRGDYRGHQDGDDPVGAAAHGQRRGLSHARDRPRAQHPSSLLIAAVLIILAYWIANPILSAVDPPFARINLPLGLAAIFLGVFTVVVRREAVPQLLGLLALENGVFFAGIAIVPDLPVIAELAAAVDVPVVALVVGLLTRRIYTQLGTTSVGQLASLRER